MGIFRASLTIAVRCSSTRRPGRRSAGRQVRRLRSRRVPQKGRRSICQLSSHWVRQRARWSVHRSPHQTPPPKGAAVWDTTCAAERDTARQPTRCTDCRTIRRTIRLPVWWPIRRTVWCSVWRAGQRAGLATARHKHCSQPGPDAGAMSPLCGNVRQRGRDYQCDPRAVAGRREIESPFVGHPRLRRASAARRRLLAAPGP